MIESPTESIAPFAPADTKLTGDFQNKEIISMLHSKCFNEGIMGSDIFVKNQEYKKTIYDLEKCPKNLAGPVHGLCMKLFNGNIEISVGDNSPLILARTPLK